MTIAGELLDRKIVWRKKEGALFNKLEEAAYDLNEFFNIKFGYKVLMNSDIVRLEKTPSKPEPWMISEDLKSKDEYLMLFCCLIFLEELDDDDSFILNNVLEAIELYMPTEYKPDWTQAGSRYRVVRVLKYLVSNDIVYIQDGNVEQFKAGEEERRVLFRNTGLSRYLMTYQDEHDKANESINEYLDNIKSSLEGDTGEHRKFRCYRRLLFEPAVYPESSTDLDFIYLKNYHSHIRRDFEKHLGVEFHIYSDVAYLLYPENSRNRQHFPNDSMQSDIMLLSCAWLNEKVTALKSDSEGRLIISMSAFEKGLLQIKERHSKLWTTAYKNMKDIEYFNEIKTSMEEYRMIKCLEKINKIVILPGVSMFTGRYESQKNTKIGVVNNE